MRGESHTAREDVERDLVVLDVVERLALPLAVVPGIPPDFALVRLLLPAAHLFLPAWFHRRVNPARPGHYD